MRTYKIIMSLILIGILKNSYATNENPDPCFRTALLPISSYSFYGSPSPSEAYDAKRSHLFPFSCTATELGGLRPIVQYRSFSGVEKPYNVVVRNKDQLFLYGGSQAGLDPTPPTAYVVSINANTLKQNWRTSLQTVSEAISWNYSGALAVHSNGFLYVIYSNFLKKIDPVSGKIIATIQLTAANNDYTNSTYNGLIFDNLGHILVKSVNRSVNCTIDGLQAFTKCPIATTPSILLSIDPETMKVIDSVSMPENVAGRLSYYQGHVYLAGKHLFRYEVSSQGKFTYDNKWGMVSYQTNSQTMGTAATFLTVQNESYVIIENNFFPSTTPASIYAISTKNSAIKTSIMPFETIYSGRVSQEPSLPSVDEENHMIYAADGRYGQLAGIRIEPGPQLILIWKKRIRTFDFTNLIGGAESRELLTTDVTANLQYSRLKWLDAKTGRMIAAAHYVVAGPGLTISPGYNGRFYQLGYNGVLSEWSFIH